MRLYLSLALAFIAVTMSARSYDTLYLAWNDGTEQSTSYAVSDVSGITFDATAGTMTVTLASGKTATYSDSQGWTMGFSADITGIEQVGADASEGAAPVEVYNLQGVRVATGSTDGLPAGVYILRQGTRVTKIMNR